MLEPEETAVTKPVAVELAEVPVAVAVAVVVVSEVAREMISNGFNDVGSGMCQFIPTLWPSEAQLLAKNFREVSLSEQLLEIADWILLASEPQMVLESAGLG